MRISTTTIERVRERSQILDQFSDSELKRSGREFLAKCPWHDDQRPSLTVSPKTNRAYCFVCARGVDSIGWIQDRFGLSFTDAVLRLADQYGVVVETENPEDAQRFEAEKLEREKLYAERQALQERLHAELWLSPGLAYLYGRGLTNETIESWGLGWNGSRITFPLWDATGKVVAHTGRVINDDEKPKYKNSQNSLIYQKSEMVYGLHKAMDGIAKNGSVIICEGQMDVIRCWQEGITNIVAVSGSSLTSGMINRLITRTKAKKITLAFDGDLAGRKAAGRARIELMDLALKGGVQIKILSMPDGKDPADLAAIKGQFLDLVNSAPSWVEWWLNDSLRELDLATPDGLIVAEQCATEILRVLPDGALREYVKASCKEILKTVPKVEAANITTHKQLDRCRWAERRAVRLYLLDSGCRPAIRNLKFTDPTVSKAFELIDSLEAMCPSRPGILKPAFERIVSVASQEEQSELMPLVLPIPEVRRVIEANPLGELEAAMAVLLSPACSG